MKHRNFVFFLLMLLFTASSLADVRTGENVSITGVINDDVYVAGGEVDSLARIMGDLVIAGGELNIESEVLADVLAAGGKVTLRGRIHDDVRIAGGDLVIQALIKDDLIAAGGKIRLAANTRVGGGSSLAGGEIYVNGRIDGPLHVSAGKLVIAGSVGADVMILAEEIEILSGAKIDGDLRYRSANPALIHDGAEITGDVVHTKIDVPVGMLVGIIAMAAAIYFTLIVTAIALYLLFTKTAVQTASIARGGYWSCVGLGLALLTATPLVAVILLSTGIGILLAVILLLSYLLLLLIGYIDGAYIFTAWLRNLFNSKSENRLTGSIWLAGSLLLLSVISLLPLLGFVVMLLVLTSGMGCCVKLLTNSTKGGELDTAQA